MVQEAQGTEKPCRAPRNEFFLGRDSWNEQYYSLRSYKWGYNFSWHHTIFCATPTVLQHFCVTDSQTAIQDLLFRDICFRILALETDSKNPKNRADDRKKKSRQPQRTKNQFFLNSSVAQHPMACVHRPPKNFGGQPPHRSQFCFFLRLKQFSVRSQLSNFWEVAHSLYWPPSFFGTRKNSNTSLLRAQGTRVSFPHATPAIHA